ncbi:MAG: hypothetical protein JW928_03925 [Candidatus Aureabacteria bacterium]|nr:hypothetical protein [Candidatus Auribacterota bacterium]
MGFFPDPRRQGDIKFVFWKKLPYKTRMMFIGAFLVAGILTQLFLSFYVGIILFIMASALGIVRGYHHNPRVRISVAEWHQVTPDEFNKVIVRQKQLARWDTDMFDITNFLGCFCFVFLAGLFFFMALFIGKRFGDQGIIYWAVDAFILFVPQWLSGVKSYLKKDKLIIKIKLLQEIMKTLADPSDVQVLPMMSTSEAGKDKRVPIDARLMIRLLGAPKDFMGVQVQVSINTVQGHHYPYLYCVLIAKEKKGYFKSYRSLKTRSMKFLVFEETHSEDVDVLVIRQKTTRTSGYHTKTGAAVAIVLHSLAVARGLIKQNLEKK